VVGFLPEALAGPEMMAGQEFLGRQPAPAFELERLDPQRIASTRNQEPSLINLENFARGSLGGRRLGLPNF
jgi:hypothetical protein